jgi:hypothetical protein
MMQYECLATMLYNNRADGVIKNVACAALFIVPHKKTSAVN